MEQEETRRVMIDLAIKKFFRMETSADTMAELKKLSPEDRAYFKAQLAAIGINCE